MEDLLKYTRIQGAIERISATGRISVAALETNFVVFGCESGHVHVLSLASQNIQKLRPHRSVVKGLSLSFDGAVLTIVSVSVDGRAVTTALASDDTRQNSITLGEPLSAVCLEPLSTSSTSSGSTSGSSSSNSSGRRLLVGSHRGALLYQRSTWFSQKCSVLYPGDGSPVRSIAWRGNLVAWADDSFIRLLDISTQTAICQVGPPHGVGVSDPYPPSLYWKSNDELLIGWADCCKLLSVRSALAEGLTSDDEPNKFVAKTIIEWTTDTIISDLVPFGEDHVAYIGYTPTNLLSHHDQVIAEDFNEDQENDDEDDDETQMDTQDNQPELIIARLKDGKVLCADVLPLRGLNYLGPAAYTLLTSAKCTGGSNNNQESVWRLRATDSIASTMPGKNALNPPLARSGANSMESAPSLFVVCPTDLVCGRIRSVDERVRSALIQKDLRLACDIANADRTALRIYKFPELLAVYLDSLLQRANSLLPVNSIVSGPATGNNKGTHNDISPLLSYAASECARLIGTDTELWSIWVERFATNEALEAICPLIPLSRPRLDPATYTFVLNVLLQKESFTTFLTILKKWSQAPPPECFSRDAMIGQLTSLRQKLSTPSANSTTASLSSVMNRVTTGVSNANRFSVYLEALASLYLAKKDYDAVLDCYLSPDVDAFFADAARAAAAACGGTAAIHTELRELAKLGFSAYGNPQSSLRGVTAGLEYRYVFDMIVEKSQYRRVESQVINLIRLSKPLSARLLLSHLDRFPPNVVYSQLSGDDSLLLWYLHILFTDPAAREVYTQKSEYGELHLIQLQLYAQFAPSFALEISTTGNVFDTLLMAFLRADLVPLERALAVCEERKLIPEVVYLKSRMGRRKEALELLLREVGCVQTAIQFIEDQFPESSTFATHTGFGGHVYSDIDEEEERKRESLLAAAEEEQLWDLLIYHVAAAEDSSLLEALIDSVGSCRISPLKVLNCLPLRRSIPGMRQKMVTMLAKVERDKELRRFNQQILQKDCAALVALKNGGQRKALRIDSQPRCAACMRPVVFEAGEGGGSHVLPELKKDITVWGPPSEGGAVVFSNKLVFHRKCYGRL